MVRKSFSNGGLLVACAPNRRPIEYADLRDRPRGHALVPAPGGDDEQRVGDLTATLIVVDDAGHVLIVSHRDGVSLF